MRQTYEEATQHLESIGFTKTGPHEFTHTFRGNRKAIIWAKSLRVTIVEYGPKTGRHLSEYTVDNAKKIKL